MKQSLEQFCVNSWGKKKKKILKLSSAAKPKRLLLEEFSTKPSPYTFGLEKQAWQFSVPYTFWDFCVCYQRLHSFKAITPMGMTCFLSSAFRQDHCPFGSGTNVCWMDRAIFFYLRSSIQLDPGIFFTSQVSISPLKSPTPCQLFKPANMFDSNT